jgi:hypothetical protein
VHQEVEDHLREAAAADGQRRNSEQRAIASFGDPDAIAAQFAAVWLAGLTILVIFAAFLAMKGRLR